MEEGKVQRRSQHHKGRTARTSHQNRCCVVAAQVVFANLANAFLQDNVADNHFQELCRCPAALRVTNAHGSNLFDIFVRTECKQISILAEMIRLDPDAARPTDVGLDMLYCAMNGDESSFATVLDTWPQLVRVEDHREDTALHVACNQSRPAFIIKALIDRWPEALHLVNDSYQLPFHRLFKPYGGGPTVDALQVLLDAADPDDLLPLLTQHEFNGHSPVHAACVSEQISMDVFLLLFRRCPGAFDTVDEGGGTPFSYACSRGVVDKVLHLLVQNRSYGYVADYNGLLPMHWSKKKAVIDALLLACPDAVRLASKDGQMPLHSACRRNSPEVGIIETLLAAYPEAIDVTDNNGMLPLHYLSRNRFRTCDMEEILLVLRASPKAVRHRDNHGRLPLHYACQIVPGEIWDHTLIGNLIEVWSGALEVVDGHGMLPLHYACQHDLKLDIVYTLLRAAPNQGRALVPAYCAK